MPLLISILLLITLTVNGQKKKEKWDFTLIMKDKSEKSIKVWSNDQSTIYSEPNRKGPISISSIDTLVLINETKSNLKEFVWMLPIKLSNNQSFVIRDLFISDLPYTKSGELVFESNVSILNNNGSELFDQIISKLKNYTKDLTIAESDRNKSSIKTDIVYPLSPGTRADKYLFYEYSSVRFNVNIDFDSDSLRTKIKIIEYVFEKNIGTSPSNSDPSLKYYPNDIFRITNYYKKDRPIKFYRILKNETIGISKNLINYINGIL